MSSSITDTPSTDGLLAVVTTVDSEELARSIARTLVERRLAACVQISAISSVYEWRDDIAEDAEFRLIAKTKAARYADVERAILELHSYDLPAVYALDVQHCSVAYDDWVADQVRGD